MPLALYLINSILRGIDAEPGVPPPTHARRNRHIDLAGVKKQAENPLLPELRRTVPPDVGYIHENVRSL